MLKLTTEQAYLAAFAFIEKRYSFTKSDELGSLLGDMSLLPDGGSADPALLEDWHEAVKMAQTGQINAQIQLQRP